MASVLYILSAGPSAASDIALCRFAQFLGLRAEIVPLGGADSGIPEALLSHEKDGRVLAIGSTALRQAFRRDWFAKLLERTTFVFLYGFAPTCGESPELKWLTNEALCSVTSIFNEPKEFTVVSDVKFRSLSVAGRSYAVESHPVAAFSAVAAGANFQSYISVNGNPHFVGITRGRSVFFLLAEPLLVDLDQVISPEVSLRRYYAQLIAMVIFLRTAFADRCWTAPVTGATFIVDDPYLKRRYGFIHYGTLIQELLRTRGALTIAFIPYNYRRSDPQIVELLRQNSQRFSIAIHGCDHTSAEFASLDGAWLAGLTACASDRMAAHARETQMPFDNILVFPQGQFSLVAISALKSHGILAAVNTTPWPVDYGESPLTIRDLLEVAVTRYQSFPIFVRRYPRDTFDLAFDALFQKPVIAVEHHGFFRHGHGAFAKLIQDVSSFGGNVVWMPLGEAVKSSCLVKRTGAGQFALKHFAPVLRFKNTTMERLELALEKPEGHAVPQTVLIGGCPVAFEINSGTLKYSADLDPGQEMDVEVIYHRNLRRTPRTSWNYRLGVSGRRWLSEFRDNQLARNEKVLLFAERIRTSLAGRRANTKAKSQP